MTPSSSSVSLSSGQVPRSRSSTIWFFSSRSAYWSARVGIILRNFAQLLLEAAGDVLHHAADLEVAGVHPLARGHLEQVEDELALPERVPEHRDRPEVERARAQPDQMRGDPVQLEVDHPQVLSARRHLDVEQRLDGAAERHRVEVVAQVVHPLDDRDHLPVGLVLGGLLDPGVDVADDRLDVANDLALERREQPQHAVGRRVVRPDVERQQLVGLARPRRRARQRDRLLALAVILGREGRSLACARAGGGHTYFP